MLGGMQCHLDSSVVRVRRMGMVVGECMSSRMDVGGTAKLKFEVLYNRGVMRCQGASLSIDVDM